MSIQSFMEATGDGIPDWAGKCREGISGLLAAVINPSSPRYPILEVEAVQTIQERYDHWTGYLDALKDAVDPSSLDYRLRDTPTVKSAILDILLDLHKSLEAANDIVLGERECRVWSGPVVTENEDLDEFDISSTESDTSSFRSPGHDANSSAPTSEIQELMSAIKVSLDSLFKITQFIPNSTSWDRRARAATITPSDSTADIILVQDRFPSLAKAHPALAIRIGEANARRRQYFRYRRSHHERLSADEHTQDQVWDSAPLEPAMSTLSSATSITEAPNEELAFPPIPTDAESGTRFLCPFCFEYQEPQLGDLQKAWRKHVLDDLEPYICTFSPCTLDTFNSRRAWFEHELLAHRHRWLCQHCLTYFTSPDNLAVHICLEHLDTVQGSQVQAIVEQSKRRIEFIQPAECPFCDVSWAEADRNRNGDPKPSIVSLDEFERHVGHHMQQIALFALQSPAQHVHSMSPQRISDLDSIEVPLTQQQKAHPDDPLKRSENPTNAVDLDSSPIPREEIGQAADMDVWPDRDDEVEPLGFGEPHSWHSAPLLSSARSPKASPLTSSSTPAFSKVRNFSTSIIIPEMPAAKRIRTRGRFRASSSLSRPSSPDAGETTTPAPTSSVGQTSDWMLKESLTQSNTRRQLKREEYTIGWICALSIELAAAKQMLDEVHQNLPSNEADSNTYELGRIGEHNVVIACLPVGQMGTTPAASVVARMQSTFSSIRFGLMVGIGGGVPSSKNDIRLGDVVVSQPSNGHGGVIQYDFGKTTPDKFERTGFLNSPPIVLLNAVANMRANYDLGGKILCHPTQLSRQPLFARENAGPDVLYRADYNHEQPGTSDCSECKTDFIKRRQPRGNDFVIHYGTIASGNQVVRDATTRDRLSKDFGGVLCFEMEAAGLMNHFPCLVVRGICDYADSHKNKSWQPYAAVTAAAYAKEILLSIPAAEVETGSSAVEVMKQNLEFNKVLGKLPTAVDTPFNVRKREHDTACLPDTRVALLKQIYEWADGMDSPNIFWLSGLAGYGKSTVARTVAARCFKKGLSASFFFTKGGGDVGHAGMFVTSIAVQLANNVPDLKPVICDAIAKHSNIASLSLREQWDRLVLAPISLFGTDQSTPKFLLIVDALDECTDESDVRIILQLFAELRGSHQTRLRVFLTSRPEAHIRDGIQHIPEVEHYDFELHGIQQSVVEHDIRVFLGHEFRRISCKYFDRTNWPSEQIINRLVQNASGLFIWAATACRFISEGKQFAADRLDSILDQGHTEGNTPEKQLNDIYSTVLEQSIPASFSEKEKEKLRSMLKSQLGSIVTLFSPLSTHSLSKLLNIPQNDVSQTMSDLHAILDIPKEPGYALRLHHPSFR
ncbi:hypothetical protein EJ06DRAFT_225929, partial [Trichodelitschia bisporula]